MPSASADSKQDRSRDFARFVHRGSKCGSDGECQTSKLENTELPSRTRRTRACPTPPPNARPESHRQGNELHTRRVPSEGLRVPRRSSLNQTKPTSVSFYNETF